MKKRAPPAIAARKRPSQERSARLVADVLEAARRVLARQGARKFTAARVAEEAGVSVGSLYQYFPNKEAILFRLQADEWEDTGALLLDILRDQGRPPPDRLRRAVRTFFHSEREEAGLRAALGAAASHYRASPETRAHREAAGRTVLAFLEEALPGVPAPERELAAEVVMTSMSAIGKRITDEPRTRAEIDAWAGAVGEMFAGYLRGLADQHAPVARRRRGGPDEEGG